MCHILSNVGVFLNYADVSKMGAAMKKVIGLVFLLTVFSLYSVSALGCSVESMSLQNAKDSVPSGTLLIISGKTANCPDESTLYLSLEEIDGTNRQLTTQSLIPVMVSGGKFSHVIHTTFEQLDGVFEGKPQPVEYAVSVRTSIGSKAIATTDSVTILPSPITFQFTPILSEPYASGTFVLTSTSEERIEGFVFVSYAPPAAELHSLFDSRVGKTIPSYWENEDDYHPVYSFSLEGGQTTEHTFVFPTPLPKNAYVGYVVVDGSGEYLMPAIPRAFPLIHSAPITGFSIFDSGAYFATHRWILVGMVAFVFLILLSLVLLHIAHVRQSFHEAKLTHSPVQSQQFGSIK